MKTYTGHSNVKYSVTACIIDPESEEVKEGKVDRVGRRDKAPDAWVVSGSDTSEVWIWDLQTKEVLQKLGEHTGE